MGDGQFSLKPKPRAPYEGNGGKLLILRGLQKFAGREAWQEISEPGAPFLPRFLRQKACPELVEGWGF